MVLDQKTSIDKFLLIKIGDEVIKISLNNSNLWKFIIIIILL